MEKDFGRLDTSKNYSNQLIFGTNCQCSFTAYSTNLSEFKDSDRKVLWVAVNLIIWLQFYDWPRYGMEENNNNICPGDILSARVSYS